MQVNSQMIRMVTKSEEPIPNATEKASTQPFPRREKATLRNNKKKPQFHLSDGTIWHGPTFKNFAMPIDAAKTEIENVVQYMMYG